MATRSGRFHSRSQPRAQITHSPYRPIRRSEDEQCHRSEEQVESQRSPARRGRHQQQQQQSSFDDLVIEEPKETNQSAEAYRQISGNLVSSIRH